MGDGHGLPQNGQTINLLMPAATLVVGIIFYGHLNPRRQEPAARMKYFGHSLQQPL
jgi:hypothetical protein